MTSTTDDAVTRPTWRRAVQFAAWGLACGATLGVAVRLAMHFVALEACVPSGFSVGGTLEVVAAGTALGAPLAVGYRVLLVRVPTLTRWTAPIGALGVLVMLALVPPPAAQSALADTPDTPAATAATFALCFAAWGLGLDRFARRGSPVRQPLSAG